MKIGENGPVLHITSSPTKEELILLFQEYEKKALFAEQTDFVNALLRARHRFKVKEIYNLYTTSKESGGARKLVYHWFLVAPWFATELLKRHKIVFYVHGAYYWGATHDQDKEETLLRIYTDIARFDLSGDA